MDKRTEEIKDRLSKATEGDWKQNDAVGFDRRIYGKVGDRNVVVLDSQSLFDNDDDLYFVLNARQDIPYLLEKLADQTEEVQR